MTNPNVGSSPVNMIASGTISNTSRTKRTAAEILAAIKQKMDPHQVQQQVNVPVKKAKKKAAKKTAPTVFSLSPALHTDLGRVTKEDAAPFLKTCFDITWDETTLYRVLDGLPALSPQGPWLAGGAIRRTLLDEEPEADFDVFFADPKQSKAFMTKLKKAGFEKSKETKNYKQFRGEIAGEPREIQCVNNVFYSSPQQVVASFDFTICMFAYDGEHIYLGHSAISDLDEKALVNNIINNPMKSMSRVLKYVGQGFMPTKAALLAINKVAEEQEMNEDNY